MRYEGQEPFQRPMRPDRVEMIRQTAMAVARDEVGQSSLTSPRASMIT